MAVQQENKKKVRPVLDYCENDSVCLKSHGRGKSVPGNSLKMAAGWRESSLSGPPEGLSAAARGRKFVEILNSQVQW